MLIIKTTAFSVVVFFEGMHCKNKTIQTIKTITFETKIKS